MASRHAQLNTSDWPSIQPSGGDAEGGESPASKTRRLNIHDTYQVEWTPEMLARDIIQNYYDSVPHSEFSRKVKIKTNQRRGSVTISGPAHFDIELLWRFGLTTKADRPHEYAGGFGEGFTLAVLQILKQNADALAYIDVGGQRARFHFDEVALDDLKVRELLCTIEEIEPVEGSLLTLQGCDKTFVRAFEGGHRFFYYPDNPLFGERIDWLSYSPEEFDPEEFDEEFDGLEETHAGEEPCAIFRSSVPGGAIFYRRQLRGSIDVPFVFCFHEPLKGINAGRDRLHLNKKEIRKILEACVHFLDEGVIEGILMEELKPLWQSGHPLLHVLANYWHDQSLYEIEFPQDYVADTGNYVTKKIAKDQGKKICPLYMAAFGMPTTDDNAGARKEAVIREPKTALPLTAAAPETGGHPESQSNTAATLDEWGAFEILEEAYTLLTGNYLTGWRMLVFEPTPEEAEPKDFHRYQTILLKPQDLEKTFGHALSEFIYQAENEFTEYHDSSFTDSLTDIIEVALIKRQELSPLEKRWRELQAAKEQPLSAAQCLRAVLHYRETMRGREDVLTRIESTARAGLNIAGIDITALFKLGDEYRPAAEDWLDAVRRGLSGNDRRTASLLLVEWASALYWESDLYLSLPVFQALPEEHLRNFIRYEEDGAQGELPAHLVDLAAKYARVLRVTKLAYRAAIFLDPTNGSAIHRLVLCSPLLPEDRSEFYGYISAGISDQREDCTRNWLRGEIEYRLKAYERAAEIFEECIELEPDGEDLRLCLAKSCLSNNRWGEGFAAVLSALKIICRKKARHAYPFNFLAQPLFEPGMPGWIAEVSAGVAKDPETPNSLAQRVILFFYLKQQDHAFQEHYVNSLGVLRSAATPSEFESHITRVLNDLAERLDERLVHLFSHTLQYILEVLDGDEKR